MPGDGKRFAVVADEIRKLATESGETATTIQEVTDSVVKAVNQLTKDSRRLLDFVATDVKSSYDSFESLADACKPGFRVCGRSCIGFQCDIRGTLSFHGRHDECNRGRCKCGKRGRKRDLRHGRTHPEHHHAVLRWQRPREQAGAAAETLKADTEIFKV